MGCVSSCETEESTLTCPFGTCSIKHCGGKVKEERQAPPLSEAELELRLAERARAHKAIEDALATNGVLPTFAQLQELMRTPVTQVRSLCLPADSPRRFSSTAEKAPEGDKKDA